MELVRLFLQAADHHVSANKRLCCLLFISAPTFCCVGDTQDEERHKHRVENENLKYWKKKVTMMLERGKTKLGNGEETLLAVSLSYRKGKEVGITETGESSSQRTRSQRFLLLQVKVKQREKNENKEPQRGR